MGLIRDLLLAIVGGARAPVRPAPRPANRSPRPAAPRSTSNGGETLHRAISPGPEWRQMVSSRQDVVGEQYYRDDVLGFIDGDDLAVEVVREPDHPNDPNAIAVFGVWTERGARQRGKLGYLPGELAAEIAKTRPSDLPILAGPARSWRSAKGFVDVSIYLFEPSARSDYWKERGGAPPKLAAVWT